MIGATRVPHRPLACGAAQSNAEGAGNDAQLEVASARGDGSDRLHAHAGEKNEADRTWGGPARKRPNRDAGDP